MGFMEESRQDVLKKWKKQAVEKGWQASHRITSVAGLLRQTIARGLHMAQGFREERISVSRELNGILISSIAVVYPQ